MKKSLSLLIALAMVFGMFASMASAATTELTTAQKYQWFVDQGVLKGDPSGNPRLDATLTRAEFATIVASVGGLKLVNSASSFSDVKVKDWYFTAIQSASDAGLVNGIGAGKFGPKLNVTVEQVIKVAVSLAGIKPVDGAVVAGSSAWAGPYIQAAINAGLAVPSNYKSNATRGQTIDVAYVVTQLKARPVLDGVTATVNADDTITVSGKVVGTADSVKVALGTATAVAATLKDDKTFTYTTAKQVPGSYKLTVVAYDGEKASVAVEKEVTIGGFVVESATALNTKQIAVKFNKAVQEGTSVGGATYGIGTGTANDAYVTLGNEEPKYASVSDDKMTVTYTFEKKANNVYFPLTVSGQKSSSGQTVTTYKSAILVNDTTAPTITGVSYSGTTATISLSEAIPVGNVGTISINGVQAYPTNNTGTDYIQSSDLVVSAADNATADKWISAINVKNLTPGTNYSFYLVGGADAVGNRFDYNTTLNVASDTTAPTITGVTVDGGVITATFSEKLSSAGVVYKGAASATATAVQGDLSSDKMSVSYDTKTHNNAQWLNGAAFLNTTAVFSGYKDLQGNTGANYSAAVSLSVDNTKPTVVGVSYDGTYLYVQYSEALNAAATNLEIKGSLVNTGSISKDYTKPTAGAAVGKDLNNDGDYADTNENFYVRIPASGLEAGSYSLGTIPAGLATDKNGNPSEAGSASFSVAAGTVTGSVALNSISYTPGTTAGGNNSVFVLNFNAPLAQSALDVSKVTLNGVALPTGSSLVFVTDASHIKVTVPAGTFPVTGERVVKVNNMVDTSGNTLNSDAVSKPQVFNENVAPVAQSVAVVSDTVLAVTFSETLLNSSLSSTGIYVYLNGSTTATTVTADSISNNVLYLKAGLTGTFSNSQTVQVKFANAAVTDMSGNKAADITINK